MLVLWCARTTPTLSSIARSVRRSLALTFQTVNFLTYRSSSRCFGRKRLLCASQLNSHLSSFQLRHRTLLIFNYGSVKDKCEAVPTAQCTVDRVVRLVDIQSTGADNSSASFPGRGPIQSTWEACVSLSVLRPHDAHPRPATQPPLGA